MKRSRLRQKPRDRGTDKDAAYAWFMAVAHRKVCVVCNKKHPQMQGHHVIEQQVIRTEFPFGAIRRDPYSLTSDEFAETICFDRVWWPAPRGYIAHVEAGPFRSLQELLWDVRNGIPLCPDDHERHTNASGRVPLEKIPAAAISFAHELGQQHRLGPRHYAPVS